MEESHEILLKSMESHGVVIPLSVSSIGDLTPTTLVSLCAQCLNLIDHTASFPTSLPSDSVADRVSICTNIASAVRNLGYVGDISFHKFLYPSEEDLYKLIRFLAERISESSEIGMVADHKNIDARNKLREEYSKIAFGDSTKKADDEGVFSDYSKVENKLNDLRLETQTPATAGTKADSSIDWPNETYLYPKEMDVMAAANESSSRVASFGKDKQNCVLNEKDLAEGQVDAESGSFGNEETAAHIGDGHMTVLKQKEKVLKDEVTVRTSELVHLERELKLLSAAAEMASSNQHSVDFYLDQFNEQVQAKRHNLSKLESEWDAVRKPLEERKRTLEESLFSNNPDAQEMLQQLREVQQEEQFILSEIRKREEEYSKLSADPEKQLKVASRKSYTQRIKEITKNSRKQDADIERILKETRELQLESNSIQERLHRTYAVADEIVFREAKKDPTGQQIYRLLASIHGGFEQMSVKILATDRIRREIVEYEMKLAATASRSLDVDKLQADLDTIIRENEYLGQQFQDK